jgi:hypothetical protein
MRDPQTFGPRLGRRRDTLHGWSAARSSTSCGSACPDERMTTRQQVHVSPNNLLLESRWGTAGRVAAVVGVDQ